MKESGHSRVYTYLESLLPKDHEYHSRSIVPHRILHDVAFGTIVGGLCLTFTNSVLVRVGVGAVTAFVTEFYIQPRLWEILLKSRR